MSSGSASHLLCFYVYSPLGPQSYDRGSPIRTTIWMAQNFIFFPKCYEGLQKQELNLSRLGKIISDYKIGYLFISLIYQLCLFIVLVIPYFDSTFKLEKNYIYFV